MKAIYVIASWALLVLLTIACQKETITCTTAPSEFATAHQHNLEALQQAYPNWYAHLQTEQQTEEASTLIIPIYNSDESIQAAFISDQQQAWIIDLSNLEKSIQLLDVRQQLVVGTYATQFDPIAQVYRPIVPATNSKYLTRDECEQLCIEEFEAAPIINGIPATEAFIRFITCIRGCSLID